MLRHYITENIETHNNIEINLLWNIVRYFQIQVITHRTFSYFSFVRKIRTRNNYDIFYGQDAKPII